MTADAVGGVWTYVLGLVRALRSTEFIVATMGPLPSPSQCAEASLLPNLTLASECFALEWMEDPWSGVEEAGK